MYMASYTAIPYLLQRIMYAYTYSWLHTYVYSIYIIIIIIYLQFMLACSLIGSGFWIEFSRLAIDWDIYIHRNTKELWGA